MAKNIERDDEWIKNKILRIVDACFHMYASDYRIDAKALAEEAWDRIKNED